MFNKNNSKLRNNPTNIIEIIDAVKEYRKIESIRNKISNSTERKIYMADNKEVLTELFSFISAGIKLDEHSLKDDVIYKISNFLGLDKNIVIKILNDTQIFLSDVNFTSNTDAYESSGAVYFDYRKANFDKYGNFIEFKKEEISFVSHVLTHEFFHVLSQKKYKGSISFSEDALSEGTTEMLTEMVTGKKYTKSYSFLVSVCSLFRDIMGINKILDDYLNNLENLPNLKNLFLECGVSEREFNNFHTYLNNILNLTMKRDNNKFEFIIEEQEKCITFLKECIVEPYCQNHPENEGKVITTFNKLFPNQEKKPKNNVK